MNYQQPAKPQHIHTVAFAQPIPTERKTSVWHLFTSSVAALASRTFTSPLERLKLLRQVGRPEFAGLSMMDSWSRIYRLEGARGFLIGNGANVIRAVPFSAIEFHSFVFFKDWILPPDSPRHKASLLYCGALAGITASVLTYPLDFIRTVLTVQTPHKYRGMRDVARRLYVKKGPLAFYRGMFTSLLGIVPYIGLKMTAYDLLKLYYYPSYTDPSFQLVTLAYGALAGTIATTLTYPTDLIRRKVQVIAVEPVPYHNMRTAVKHTWRSEGLSGFFKGLVPCYLKVVPVAAIGFLVNENLKGLLNIK